MSCGRSAYLVFSMGRTQRDYLLHDFACTAALRLTRAEDR